jgi:hypothetical protein
VFICIRELANRCTVLWVRRWWQQMNYSHVDYVYRYVCVSKLPTACWYAYVTMLMLTLAQYMHDTEGRFQNLRRTRLETLCIPVQTTHFQSRFTRVWDFITECSLLTIWPTCFLLVSYLFKLWIRWSVFGVPLSPSRKILSECLRRATIASFLILSDSMFTYHPIIVCYKTWTVVKVWLNKLRINQ